MVTKSGSKSLKTADFLAQDYKVSRLGIKGNRDGKWPIVWYKVWYKPARMTLFVSELFRPMRYCADRGIEFTRSRAYRKNDQAWVEQKNGAVIRRFLGHERYSGQVAGQTIAHLHGAMRLYVNYFQPSFKLMEETRKGSVVTKRYNSPATPCERVLQHEAVGAETRASLNERRARLDPVALLHSIRETQSALAAIVSPEIRPTPRGESLERFLVKLPDRWRQDEEAALRPAKVRVPRT